MEDKEKPIVETVIGEMHKRRETMPDAKRYIIYYTFGDENSAAQTETENAEEASENV